MPAKSKMKEYRISIKDLLGITYSIKLMNKHNLFKLRYKKNSKFTAKKYKQYSP